jgi:hypothetical protein
MGVIQVPGERSGQLYSVQIDGDVPTNTEYARIANYVKQQEDAFAQRYEQSFGEVLEEDDGTAIGRGFTRGKQQIKQAFGETLGTIGEQAGLGFLAEYGQGVEENARQRLGELMIEQPERMQSTDVEGVMSGLTYAGEVVGEQIPQLGLGLAAAAAAPVLAPAAATTTALGSFAVGAGAAAATTAPILFGNNIQRQEDEVAQGKKESVDVSDALVATFGQAALEGISDKILLGGLFRPLGKSLFARTATRAGGGATTEALTEVGQQMMERAQAGLPIDSDDAIAEYREAAIAGGLIGGGVRATGIGERAPKITETDGTTTDRGGEVTEDTQTTPQLQEGQEQGELFAAEETTALKTEAQNAADPTPPKGKAEQTDEQRAAETAAVAVGAATESPAFAADQANAVKTQGRINEKLKEKAALKTQEYLPGLEPQESGTDAIKSEQTGEQIEVGKKRTKDVLADENIANLDAFDQTIDDDFLANLNVPKQALIRREGTKKSLIGKKVSDEGVLDELKNYARISSIPEAKEGVQGFLDTLEVEDAGIRLESEGVGTGIPSGQPSVVGGRGRDSGVADTAPLAAPDAGPVGTDLLDTDGVDDTAGTQRDTLTDEERAFVEMHEKFPLPENQARYDELVQKRGGVTPEAAPEVAPEQVEEVQQLAELATATPVQVADQSEYAAAVRKAASEGTRTAADVLVEPDEIAARQATLAQSRPPVSDTPTGPMTGAIGGAETGAAAQQIPAAIPPAPRPEPTEPTAQAQTQEQIDEEARNISLQRDLDTRFAEEQSDTKEGKDTAIARQYYQEQQLESQLNDPTLSADKTSILNLFSIPKNKLTHEERGARIFFDRFRRPVDALQEIGAFEIIGPSQYTKKLYNDDEFAFYAGMTQKNALAARKWVESRLSDGAVDAMAAARRQARRDTSKFNPSDAEIEAGREAKKQAKTDRDTQNRVHKELVKELVKRNKLMASIPSQIEAMPERTRGKETVVDIDKAFDRYLRNPEGLNYSQAELDVLTDQEIADLYDGFAFTDHQVQYLNADAVHGLDIALVPSVRNALMNGNLQAAIDSIAVTNPIAKISEIAAKLGNVVGTTQVRVIDNLSQMTGRTAAGLFDPETNTILIDATNGMNVHTILHEMTHAATSASLANPSLPEVKQLQTLFNAVREQFGEVYGTTNLDEFVAEAFSNPEFQSALALTRVDGGKMSGWEKFTGAVKRIVRKLLGLSPSPTALSEVDRLIDGMLAPSPATRAAPSMLMAADNKKGAAGLVQGIANAVPASTKETVADLSSVVFDEGIGRTAKSWTLNTLPVNILTDIASKAIPFAKELNTLINKQSGALRQKSEVLDSMLNNLHAWQRKHKDQAKVLNNIIPRSTFLKVDPSRTDSEYMKKIRDDKQRSVEYDQLRAEYNKLNDAGKAFYRQLRNYFQDTYEDIIAALDARLDATIPDAEAKKNAFEQLRQLLQQDTGVIRPYFPLMRKGNYRLAYTGPDPLNPENKLGETFVEYYPTLRKAEQARAKAISSGGTDVEITEATRAMDFKKVPDTGFVRDILNTVQFNEDKFTSDENYRKVMQEIVDLSLDAMPERSFMQNFRRRKNGGVRGFLGDTTPTGMGGMDFDAYTMLKEKGRDLNRQLIQLKSAAEIEKFRAKLLPYKKDTSTAMVADKLDQIARFAQSPNLNRTSQIVNSMGFGMTMGLNFSSAAITFFDVAMSAMPVLAGKHKIGPTTGAFITATKLLAGAPSKRTVMTTGPDGKPVPQEVNMGTAGKSISNYDVNNLPEMLKAIRADILIKMGIDQGQFNQSMTQENLEVGRDAPLETFNKYSSFMFHHSERFNRETTLTAAYMLEVNKMRQEKKDPLTEADYAQAAQEAINQTEFTLGATAAAGRPIVAQSPIGNILFLFKRFAISKYYMMAKLAKEAAGGDKVAQAATRNFLVSTGLFAGLGGMPLMGGIGAMYNMFADDDEDDFEAATRKLVGEGIYGGLANEILGVDLANRISMNSLLYRAPLIDKDQSNFFTLIEQLGGPVVGVGLSIERGMKDIYEGEVQRGLEAMAPAAIRNGMKSFRFATEGAETRRGDPITEDINPYNVVMQGLGFAPQAYIQQLEFNKNNRRREEAVSSRRTKLLRRRNMALREGDYDEVQKVDALIEEYNAGLPEGAQKSRITSDTKQRSFKSFGKTTKDMRGGMTYTPFMEKSLQEFDQGFQLF